MRKLMDLFWIIALLCVLLVMGERIRELIRVADAGIHQSAEYLK